MDVRRGCVLFVVVVAAGGAGCVDILGLDHGTPEDSDASVDVADPDGAGAGPEGSAVDHASAPDAAQDHARPDAALASDARDARAMSEAASAADVAPDTVTEAASGQDAACAYTRCPSGCWDTATDPMHCGSCTQACPESPNGQATCSAGVCGHVCDQGYVDCSSKPCSCGGGKLCLSDGTCGACRAALQPCGVGTDCCSGTCGATLTCL